MGRKPLFDEVKMAKLVEYIERGMTPMGIARQTVPILRASIYNKLTELGVRKQAVYTASNEAG